MIIWIRGTKVKILKGKLKQTVNFYQEDRIGDYDPRIVLRPPVPAIGDILQKRVFGSKDEAVEYLLREHNGVIEPSLEKYRELVNRVKQQERSDEEKGGRIETESIEPSLRWAQKAKLVVERVIDRFIFEFIDFPYLHRVEHSIHCELYKLLSSERMLGNMYPMNKWASQLIHKEWPEYIPRPEKGNRRGNIDMCILSPEKLKSCSYEDFRQGRIEPDIAIEIGLDYKFKHLKEDSKKLLKSGINHTYLVHLVRQDVTDDFDAVEEFIKALKGSKAAYARLTASQAFYKLTNDTEIKTMRR